MDNNDKEFFETLETFPKLVEYNLQVSKADKKTIKELTESLAEKGKDTPKESFVLLKVIEEAAKAAKQKLYNDVLNLIEDDDHTLGCKLRIATKKETYDCSEDRKVKEINAKIEELKEELKKREAFIIASKDQENPIEEVDEETGEVFELIKPKIKSFGGQSIICNFS